MSGASDDEGDDSGVDADLPPAPPLKTKHVLLAVACAGGLMVSWALPLSSQRC